MNSIKYLDDQQLLNSIVSEIKELKETDNVRYKERLLELYDAFDISTKNVSTKRLIDDTQRVLDYAESLEEIDKEIALELLSVRLQAINHFLKSIPSKEIAAARHLNN
jgi:hypothetical protein